MAKYFIDTEFLEGKQDKTIFGIKYGETKPTIDLISIGIISEDGREYYAISKEFNLREAWNRYDLVINKQYPLGSEYGKVYWIRENVLKPIYLELLQLGKNDFQSKSRCFEFSYNDFKFLINKYGKTNKQIAEDILWFCAAEKSIFETDGLGQEVRNRLEDNPVKFYGYYSAYDHVCLAWLYGKMIDLPKGFPMFTIDLKQELDKKVKYINSITLVPNGKGYEEIEETLKRLEKMPEYPKQTNIHHALFDARFNKKLYEFLNKL